MACTLTFATGILSDRSQKRSPSIIIGLTIALIGLILLYTLPKDRLANVRYFGCVLFMSGAYCAFPGTLSWVCEYPRTSDRLRASYSATTAHAQRTIARRVASATSPSLSR